MSSKINLFALFFLKRSQVSVVLPCNQNKLMLNLIFSALFIMFKSLNYWLSLIIGKNAVCITIGLSLQATAADLKGSGADELTRAAAVSLCCMLRLLLTPPMHL